LQQNIYHESSFYLCSLSPLLFCQSGTFDPDFAGDGKALYNLSTGTEATTKIIQLPNGKILVGGYRTVGSDEDFSVMRLNPDGSLDNTFGGAGYFSADFNLNIDILQSIAVQPDGKIVCVGYTYNGPTSDILIMRFLADGGLDNSFGSGGLLTFDGAGGTDEGYDVAVQPDGKIVVVGYVDMGVSNNSYESIIYRLNSDGSPDNTFSFDGKVIPTVSTDVDVFTRVLLQPDGKIVCVGFAVISSIDGALVRFNSDGTLDNSFGTAGKVTTDYTGGATERLYGTCLQPDGKIIVCGTAYVSTDDDFIVARYNSNGSLDNTFNGSGFRSIDFGLTDDSGWATTLQSDGKIILVGSQEGTTETSAVCYRMNADGTPDISFSSGSTFIITDVQPDYSDNSFTCTMQSDGKILIGGNSTSITTTDYQTIALRILSGLTIGVAEFTKTETTPLLYPNPLQNTEHLKYTLGSDEKISIVLLDGQGKLVTTFVENENQPKGDHEVELNLPTNLPNGTYFIQIASEKGKVSIKTIK
jgi:uncharacterized delta-60 repeat protein